MNDLDRLITRDCGPLCGQSLEHVLKFFQRAIRMEVRLDNAVLQSVPGGKVNILGGHVIGHSKQATVYVHVSYSERFPT
jgi:hypothetical protein